MKKIFFLFCLFLYSCGASGPNYLQMVDKIPVLSDDSSRLFFMRPDRFEYVGRDAPIEMNGDDIGDLPNGTFFYKDINLDEVEFETSLWDVFGSSTLRFKPENGETYYILVTPREESVEAAIKGGIKGTIWESLNKKQGGAFAINLLDEKDAKKILSDLTYVKDP